MVVRMNSASNMIAKWYHKSSQRPWVTREKISAMPTARVTAPPVLPTRLGSPTAAARFAIRSAVTGNPSLVIFAAVAATLAATGRSPTSTFMLKYTPGCRVQAAIMAIMATRDSRHMAP